MPLTLADYATLTDVAAMLPSVDVTGVESALFTRFLHVASRGVDRYTDRYFYSAGVATKYFDVTRDNQNRFRLDGGMGDFFGKIGTIAAASPGAVSLTFTQTSGPAPVVGDIFQIGVGSALEMATVSAVTGAGPYTLTVGALLYSHPAGDVASTIQVKIAITENADPAVASNWITLSGNGLAPPSNYWLYPGNPPLLGASASATLTQPFYGFDLPPTANANDSTNYRPTFTKGIRTLAVTAPWGWPAIPDDLVQVSAKVAIKLWRSKDTTFTGATGAPDFAGAVPIIKYLDASDFAVLEYYSRQTF